MINNRTHYKNERRIYEYRFEQKDRINKICTMLYKMNDYYARMLIKHDYTLKDIRGVYKYKINKSQMDLKNLFVPVFKRLKRSYDLEFIRKCDLKKLPDGYYLYFYVNRDFVRSIKEKGYYYAYKELICNFDGEFDGNICKNLNKKIKSIS